MVEVRGSGEPGIWPSYLVNCPPGPDTLPPTLAIRYPELNKEIYAAYGIQIIITLKPDI